MKKKNILRILLLLFISILIFITIIIIKKDNKETNKPQEENIQTITTDVTLKKEVSNIVFDNILYTYDGKITKVNLTITNNNEKNVKINTFVIKVYDKDNKQIGVFNPNSKYEFKPKDKIDLEFFIALDLSNADYLEYELPELEIIEN